MLASALPKVGVLADKYVGAIYTLRGAQTAIMQEPCDVQAAMATAWTSDAHFTTYFPEGPADRVIPGAPWARIKKMNSTVLQEMRAYGCDLKTQVFAFDFDNPNHKPWADGEEATRWIESFARAVQDDPILGACACLYTTRAGARIIYVLDRPVSVEDGESHHRWMVQRLRAASPILSENNKVDERGKESGGICYDCCDWTRLFRLPRVLRDGTSTEHSPTFKIIEAWDARLPVDQLGRKESLKASSVVAYASVHNAKPKPFREEAIDRRERMTETGRRVQTEFFTWAKAVLKGKEVYGALFEDKPLADRGSRNTTMFRLVGQVCGTLIPRRDCDPEDIYGLFLPSVEAMDQDDSPPEGWDGCLWDMVNRIYGAEVAKKQAFFLKRQAEKREDADKMASLIEAMKEWCDAPELGDTESQEGSNIAQDFVRRRSLLLLKKSVYILHENGWYYTQPKTFDEIIPHIRSRNLEWLIPTKSLDEKSLVWRSKTAKAILDDYSTDIAEVEVRPTGKIHAHFENMGHSIKSARLVISPFARNPDIQPEPSQEVDEWLQVLFGDHYEFMVEKYIPFALAFEEGGMPALSILAGEGVGKGMFVQGMLECLCSPVAAGAQDMTSSYQYGLLKSPFIVVDEGWPPSKQGSNDVADVLRQLVTGKKIEANTKFGHPVEVAVMPRIIMTANNDSMLDIFNRVRATTLEDQKAIAVRLVHIEANDAAKDWLEAKGGMQYTGKQGRRWVAHGGTGKSDYIIAKHFLWLYSRRGVATGRRLLVDGNTDPKSLERMRLSTMQAQTIAEAIITKVERMQMTGQSLGFIWDEEMGKLYVSVKGVERACEEFSGNRSGRVDVRLRVKEVIEHLPSVCESPDAVFMDSQSGHPVDAAYYEVNIGLIVRHGQKIGQPCQNLRRMQEVQKNIKKFLSSLA